MSKNYTHLSQEQRYQIEALLKAQKNQKEIAKIIGKSESTISRELSRSIPMKGPGAKSYEAKNAQRKARLRHRLKFKGLRFSDEMKQYARNKLQHERWSPELISVEGKKELGNFVSHECIYQWIWKNKRSRRIENKQDKKLYQFLAHGRRRGKRGNLREHRGIMSNRVSIEQRPKIVAKRKRIGDLEIDLMMGKNYKGALLVTLDRASLKTKIRLVRTREKREVKASILKCYKKSCDWLKTITFDNDKAFASHHEIAHALNVKAFFTRPYTSQDKGSVENRIGILRRFFPKKMDLLKVTPSRISEVEKLLNNRPVRKFNYKTPNQIFSEKIALIT